MNNFPTANHPSGDLDIASLPITEHGTYDDRPLDMMTTAEIRASITQLRARYKASTDRRYRDALLVTHRSFSAEFRARTQ